MNKNLSWQEKGSRVGVRRPAKEALPLEEKSLQSRLFQEQTVTIDLKELPNKLFVDKVAIMSKGHSTSEAATRAGSLAGLTDHQSSVDDKGNLSEYAADRIVGVQIENDRKL